MDEALQNAVDSVWINGLAYMNSRGIWLSPDQEQSVLVSWEYAGGRSLTASTWDFLYRWCCTLVRYPVFLLSSAYSAIDITSPPEHQEHQIFDALFNTMGQFVSENTKDFDMYGGDVMYYYTVYLNTASIAAKELFMARALCISRME